MTVSPFPDALARLSINIKKGLAKAAKSRDAATRDRSEWTEAMVGVAVEVAEAKEMHKAAIDFGEWWDAQQFDLGKDERAAMVAMGKEPEQMRKAFRESESWSIQLIHRNCFRSATKPSDKRKHASKSKSAISQKTKAEADTLLRNIGVGVNEKRRTEAVRVLESGDPALVAAVIDKEAGLRTSADRAHIRAEIFAELKIDPETLKPSAKAKVEAAKHRIERELKAEHTARMKGIDEEVRQRVLKDNAEYRADLASMRSKAQSDKAFYEELINRHKPLFSADEFKTILMCLHPDGQRTAQKLAEAFRLFNAKRVQLTGQKA